MTSIEKLSEELYETLIELRYPGLAQAASRDTLETVLAHENRLSLLSWLLAQSSLVKPDEFSSKTDESKIIKWYTNLGICNNLDILMGRVPMQEQIFTLKNLLLFMRNVLRSDQSGENCADQSRIDNLSKKCTSESINIMPSTWGLAKKLTYNEALEYLNQCRESFDKKTISSVESLDETKSDLSSNTTFGSTRNSESNSGCDRRECVERFLQAFESVPSWPRSRSSEPASIITKSMDNCIDSISCNITTLKETIQSKDEISNSVVTEQLEKRDMPLDGVIDDIVIAIEQVNCLQFGE